MTFLMPDPEEARFYGLDKQYEAYRVWWSAHVAYPVIQKPEPGALDLEDGELG
jgi:hypothetical protein